MQFLYRILIFMQTDGVIGKSVLPNGWNHAFTKTGILCH